MLNLFRQNTALSAFALIMLALLLRIPLFIQYPEIQIQGSGPISVLVFKQIQHTANPLQLSFILATVLIVIQSVLLNYIVNRHEVLYKYTFLPGTIFLLASSFFPEQMQLSPQLMANTFLMLMLLRLFYLYESEQPIYLVFDAGILLGIALLFHIEMIVLLPFILISVIIFTSFNIRYIIIALLGILIPVYFIGTYFYITNRLEMFQHLIVGAVEQLDVKITINNYYAFIPLAILLIPVFLGYVGLSQNYFQNKVKTRRIHQSILLLTAFGILLLFAENTAYTQALYFVNIPLAIAAGYYFLGTKRYWFKESLFWALIICSLLFVNQVL
jgi:hypothetical protein